MKTYTSVVIYICISTFLFILPSDVFAQMEGSVYSVTGRGGVGTTFVTDYQSIGINPANLGITKNYRDPKFTFGLMEANVSFSSEAISTSELLNSITDYKTTRFNTDQKNDAVKKFSDKTTTVDASVMLFGASMKLPKKWGGVAVNIRDNIHTRTTTNEFAAEIMFFGAASSYFPKLKMANGDIIDNPRHTGSGDLTEEQRNQVIGGQFENPDDAKSYSEVLSGTSAKSTWVREYNASWGAQLLETYDLQIYGGIGARYLQGLLILDFEVDQTGTWNSPIFSSSFVNPQDVLSATSLSNTSSNGPLDADNRSMGQKIINPEPAGHGWGLDAGVTFVIKRKLRIGASISNFGKMTWSGDVYSINDGDLASISGQGLDNYNFLINDQSAFQFAGTNSPLDWETKTVDETVDLPTVVRIGASYEFFRLVHVGVDVVLPQNDAAGNLENPFYAIGGDFKPFKLFSFSSGLNFGGNDENINIPLGITYFARKGGYEAGISTHDVLSYFSQNTDGSTISIAGGFLRFKI
ncbi:hypothetical protein EI427_19950 [Flammeovirga pectinis]|uniref:DUF5723 domain-containing protein n=1 Tax=Flammeovirga pectinis TaxID=2494373 RepID=A0A3S9P872_9BACT|nr:DUF5723 family protein [Flammeovirga pectinis]AZQ64401.1 hypothetical protein EI427_19950 [Flammeovirga pectinis]